MKRPLNCGKYFLNTFFFFSLAGWSMAQPPVGIEWPARVLDYANYWWNTGYPDSPPYLFNPDYGYWDLSDDCANFQSQMAQAGCAGLCESNNNNNVDYPQHIWTSLGNCLPWRAYVSGPFFNDDMCANGPEPWPPPLMHLVVPGAQNLSWWFYYNNEGYPVEDWDVRPNDGETIPNWVGPGTFGFMEWWNSTHGRWVWHSFYIGAGTGQNAMAWSHSGDHHGEYYVRQWYELFGQDLDHWEFYQPTPSPVTNISEHNRQANTE